jgi:hypothetical protein
MTRTDTEALRDYAGTPCQIFPASRALEPAEAESLMRELNGFLSGWASHGAPVTGAAALLENRFVVVAHRPDEIAGCSRDSLLFFLQNAARERGFEWQGGARVFYKAGDGSVANVDRPEFRKLAAEGAVGGETWVYDSAVRETDAVLNGGFALQAKDSWHAKLLPA